MYSALKNHIDLFYFVLKKSFSQAIGLDDVQLLLMEIKY